MTDIFESKSLVLKKEEFAEDGIQQTIFLHRLFQRHKKIRKKRKRDNFIFIAFA